MDDSEGFARDRPTGPSDPGEDGVEEFTPTVAQSIVWTVLSLLTTIGAFILFWLLHSWIGEASTGSGALIQRETEGDKTYITVRIGAGLGMILLSVGVLVLHEAIHGAAFWYYGGKPEYGAAIVQKFLPVLYCTAPGYFFTRAQFTVIILGPLIVISALGVAAMPFVDNSMLIAAPLAINVGGAVGDVWMFGMLLRRPRGTMIEDHKEGLRFHFPPSVAID